MSLADTCGIPAGLLRLLRCLKEDVTEPISWNLQKSKEGCFSLKFWTLGFRAENGDATKDTRLKRTKTPRTATPVRVDCNSHNKRVQSSYLDAVKLPGTSTRTFGQTKSCDEQRKSKAPSRRKRDSRRRALWRLKKKATRLQAAAKPNLDCQRSTTTWKQPATGSVTPDTDSPSSEPASSGPVPHKVLDTTQPESASKDSSVTVEDLPGKQLPQDPASTVTTEPDTPNDLHTSILDSDNNCENSASILEFTENCIHCGLYECDAKLRSCSACKSVKYCSVECQKSDWPEHKQVCAYMKITGPLA